MESTISSPSKYILGFPNCSVGKESACNVGDLGSIPGLGSSPGEGNDNPLQYSGLENSMGCIWGHKESDATEQLFSLLLYLGFPAGAAVKNPPANTGDARDMGSIPGSGRSTS